MESVLKQMLPPHARTHGALRIEVYNTSTCNLARTQSLHSRWKILQSILLIDWLQKSLGVSVKLCERIFKRTLAAKSSAADVSFMDPVFVPITWRFFRTKVVGCAPTIQDPAGARRSALY